MTAGLAGTVAEVLSTRLRIRSRRFVVPDVVEIGLGADGDGPLPTWSPGAHIDVESPRGLVRQYSLCGRPADRSRYVIAARVSGPYGCAGFLGREAEVGDRLGVRGPRNHFALAPAPRYVFIAGGIGITPILPMIESVDAAGSPWELHYGGSSRASMPYLSDLARYGERLTAWPQDEVGLVDLKRIFAGLAERTAVYCCGPEPLLVAAEQQAAVHGAVELHVERFQPREITGFEPDAPFTVSLLSSGVELHIPAGVSILEAMEAAGLDVPFSCGEGICGTCETQVVEGDIDHRDSVLSSAERAAMSSMMICVSRARSERVVLDL